MTSIRNPFPFPKIQTDEDFVGQRNTQKQPYKIATTDAQRQEPWNRLNSIPTLSSARREIYHADPQAPRDSLDFVIKAHYDHHNEFLSGNNQTLVQRETVSDDPGRVLKNRVKEVIPEFDPRYPPLQKIGDNKKVNINSIEGAIQSHHNAATNRGYSRRHDGGFYST